jgi:hypothetical protein
MDHCLEAPQVIVAYIADILLDARIAIGGLQ